MQGQVELSKDPSVAVWRVDQRAEGEGEVILEAFRQNGQEPGLLGSEEEEEKLPQCLAGPLGHFSHLNCSLPSGLDIHPMPRPASLPVFLYCFHRPPFPYGAPAFPVGAHPVLH